MSIFLIILIGTLLRIVNILPYKFYPDAYQNLLVAENLAKYHTVLHTLGPNGYLFPPTIAWSRPIYSLLINLCNFVTLRAIGPLGTASNNSVTSAYAVSLIMGIFAILASNHLVSSIYKNKSAGYFAAFLTAISFNHTVWGGFVMTETTGVFFLLLFLFLLFKDLKKSELLNVHDLFAGGVLSIAIFSRYEYAILILPILYIVYKEADKPGIKLINIATGFFVVSSIIFSLFFPIKDSIWAMYLRFVSLFTFKGPSLQGGSAISMYAIAKFIEHDFLIVVCSLLGFIFMFKQKKSVITGKKMRANVTPNHLPVIPGLTGNRGEMFHLAIFLISSIFLLEYMYYRINPEMERYQTHLLPFLIIAAGFSFIKFQELFKAKPLSSPRKWGSISIFLLLSAIQLLLTFNGIKKWNNGDWTRPSYEEVSAKKLATYLKPDDVIVASLPEPYYFFNQNPTISVSNSNPYLNTTNFANDQSLLIVSDMPMKDLFPDFYNLVTQNLANKKVGEYYTNTNYRFRNDFYPEHRPIQIYKIKISDLNSFNYH